MRFEARVSDIRSTLLRIMAKRFLSAPDADSRLATAHAWLAGHAADAELLIVAPSADATNELLRRAVRASTQGAVFGTRPRNRDKR